MFNIGDKVVYHHDVCQIVALEKAYANDEDYLLLEALYKRELRYYVPVRTCEKLMRPVITRREALRIIDGMADVKPAEEASAGASGSGYSTQSRRLQERYSGYLESKTIEDLIPKMKAAHSRMAQRVESGRMPCSADKEYFEKLEGVVNDELAAALDIDRDHIAEFVTTRIRQRGGSMVYA